LAQILGFECMTELRLISRFCLAGILAGFLLGMGEGAFALLRMRHAHFFEPGLNGLILILAPLVDGLVYGLLGGFLGLASALVRRGAPRRSAYFVALGLAIAGAHLTYLVAHFWIRISRYRQVANGSIALLVGIVVAVGTLRYGTMIKARYLSLHARFWPPSRLQMRPRALFTGALLLGLVAVCLITKAPETRLKFHPNDQGDNYPNLVIITIDTARADHLSAYGYPKPTTPNLDNLARRGVLFETAIAPAPWTLPSFASVFTGSLPHQDAAARDTPLPEGFLTLATVLKSRGYQTAGFNANYVAATIRTGLAQGFEYYSDDDGTLRTDLLGIDFVKAYWWFFYYPFIRPEYIAGRSGRAINQEVFHWFRQRRKQPFFLFVNYFDAHEPYSEIPEIGGRFGNARTTLAQRLRAELDGLYLGIEVPRSPAEQAALIAGYDSGLAYADGQIGNLLQLLESSSEWSNTYIIVLGDHGQAFGTHRHYGHGWGLNWELLHVPLIIAGPGIPQGRRAKDLVGLQQVFATVLDLAGGKGGASETNSLRCSWTLPSNTCDSDPMVISELGVMPQWALSSPSISVVTPQWHLIRDAADDVQLFDLTTDPGELVNLADSPEHQVDITDLQSRLFDRVQDSLPPWLGENYLWALGARQYSLLAAKHMVHTNWPASGFQRPSTPEKELLRSLPYQ
jgi:arylsulfatase A-like enzyme